jgi:hypothetical protein
LHERNRQQHAEIAQSWIVDDVRIFECVAALPDEIFSDEFKSGDTSVWSSTVGGP